MKNSQLDFQKICRNLLVMVGCLTGATLVQPCGAQESNWIWSPQQEVVKSNGESQGECFYRKKFTLMRPEAAELYFAAGDEFEIYVNGQLASRGQSYGSLTKVDVSSLLESGTNVVAAHVRHNSSDAVGLAIRLRVREVGETRWRSLVTDATWKTRTQMLTDWKKNSYNDMGWLTAQVIGKADLSGTARAEVAGKLANSNSANSNSANASSATSQTAASSDSRTTLKSQSPALQTNSQKSNFSAPPIPPTDTSAATAAAKVGVTKQKAPKPKAVSNVAPNHSGEPRFEIDPEFVVQQVLAPNETGSLIAMEINEFGQLLLSREGGPLLIADPSKPLNDPARVRVYCDEVNSCQGILPLNGNVYVTAEGPQGLGLYLLSDSNRDGTLEVNKKLAGFTGKLGEHGPHGIQLGPDGMLYVIVGNGSQIETEPADTSPYKSFYEGDLVPRYEDPGGHAQGIKAPGGTIVRISLDGKKVETVAGGLRNAYDLVFDAQGELFTHDSDMESDMGTTWYRPTYVFHVPDGAEFGWRSGWSKFSQYFVDQTPAVCDTGRGSPTGSALYQHLQFPVRYQDTLFLADWSEGRILTLRKRPSGAGFEATPEVFLKGRPLNVCDLTVAEDGALYFCTGGRGTAGGVYRVVWNGDIPEKMLEFESDVARIIRHPQPASAWARQSIAELKREMGNKWGPALIGVVEEVRNPAKFRVRAMQLMVLYGPAPNATLLKKLATEDDAEIRVQVAKFCGLRSDGNSSELLATLMGDDNPRVRRSACESYLRLDETPQFETLVPMLRSLDRIESLSARRLLERIPVHHWEEKVLATDDKRVFIQGAVAMLTAEPTLDRSYQTLARAAQLMDGFVNDLDFVDLLRTMELALVQGDVDPARVPGLISRISNEFPSGSPIINRELVRILAYLKVGDLQGRINEYLQSEETTMPDRVHTAMYLQTIGTQLTPDARLSIIDALETAYKVKNVGGSYQRYIARAITDVSQSITPDQVDVVLQNGARWPNAVLAAFYKLPDRLDETTVQRVIELDQAVAENDDTASKQLRLGVIAILARSAGGRSMEYLRELWQTEPARRNDIVIGLAQNPDGENWAYLVSSLPILDDMTAREVIQKLTTVARRPRESQYFKSLIELGFRLRGQGSSDTVALLEHWSGESLTANSSQWQEKLNTWRTWYEQKWPDQPKIATHQSGPSAHPGLSQLLGFIETNDVGNAERGQHVFTKAQCASCHQVRGVGESVGPDLTNLAQRFSIREVLESTLEPSKTIPDRFASKIIVTDNGLQLSGMAVEQPDGAFVVLQSDGKRVRVPSDEIEAIKDSKVSAMPAGLLDDLAPSEVADLMAYLMNQQSEVASK